MQHPHLYSLLWTTSNAVREMQYALWLTIKRNKEAPRQNVTEWKTAYEKLSFLAQELRSTAEAIRTLPKPRIKP